MKTTTVLLVAAAASTLTPLAAAQSLAVSWSTIDFGGATSTAATLKLTGTIGQWDAGPAPKSLTLACAGGFWSVGSRPVPGCRGDLDDGSGLGVPDGAITIDDLLYMIAHYEGGDPLVDLDDGTMSGTPDGGVDINDLLFFIDHYESGC